MKGRKNKVFRILFALGLGCLFALLFGCGRNAVTGHGLLSLREGLFRQEENISSETEDLRTEENETQTDSGKNQTEEAWIVGNEKQSDSEKNQTEEARIVGNEKQSDSGKNQTEEARIVGNEKQSDSEQNQKAEARIEGNAKQTDSGQNQTEEARMKENENQTDSGKDQTEPESEGTETPSETILVHICGAVVSSGVYAIPEDGRVADAVEAAGGFTPDAAPDYINMAQRLYDGSKVIIPTFEEVAEEPYGQSVFVTGTEKNKGTGSSGTTSGSGSESLSGDGSKTGSTDTEFLKVNINTADAEELTRLPGIGKTRAEAIINYRRREGAFTCAEDLTKVPGIGESIFRNLRDYVSL